MKKLESGKYTYRGYTITNHGYYPPDKTTWWEAVNNETKCADYHANTKSELKDMIDHDRSVGMNRPTLKKR